MIELLIGLLVLALLAVPVLLVVALVSIGNVRRRVLALEGEIARVRAERGPMAAATAAPAFAPAQTEPRTPSPPNPPLEGEGFQRAPAASVAQTEPRTPSPPNPLLEGEGFQRAPAASVAQTEPRTPSPPNSPLEWEGFQRAPAQPNFIDLGVRAVRRWFTVGNVPVKIGMLVLLAGVAALLKYASDEGWLRLPIELRIAGVAAAALAALVFGWRQRERKRAFALALQGGAIGVLLLTVFAAFKLYALLPADAAFALSVLLIAGLGVLAVRQDSRSLAVFGLLAGFLAPIWLSSGADHHVLLFSYYALLNVAIFAIAWIRPWRVLNLLGFAFTWGIGAAWGAMVYAPAHYASTQPFLLLFFVFYLLIPILYARQRPARRGDHIDGCLLFGTPLIAFALEAALLDGDRLSLAFCALGLAAIYATLAWLLIPRERTAVLGQGHALLAVGFATLAVPLALSARATSSVFALEGAALVWLGLKQGRRLPRWTGLALQLAAAFAFFAGAYQWASDARALANPTCMGALLIALAGFASAYAWRRAGKSPVAAAYFVWGLAWWCGNAIHEIDRFVPFVSGADALLAFAALTAWLAAETNRKHSARLLVLTTLAAFVFAIPLAFAQADVHRYPFADYGLWAWLAFGVLGVRSLVCLRDSDDRFASWTQCVWWLVWPTALSLCSVWLAQRFALADGWRTLLMALPWLVVTALSQWRWSWLAAPRQARFDAYRTALQCLFFALLGIGWVLALFDAGASAPLPWVVLLNPLELAALAALALAAHWLWSGHAPVALARRRFAWMAAAGFALITCTTLRAVHHWGGVPWNADLVTTSLAQTSLTVVWSALGVAGWITGSRRGRRALWLAGAVLMALVLVKLILVDRQHLGNLLGIGSFIAYGVLCTLVGYFAPAPPRASAPIAQAIA